MNIKIIFALFLWHVSAGFSQEPGLNAKFDRLAASYQKVYGFSGTILFVSDNQKTFEKSYGLANRSFNQRNHPTTRFSINSVSKIFTTVAVLQLAEENKIGLQVPISQYLNELEADWADRVTVHHLLSHTSGLPRESGVQPEDELTFTEQLGLVGKQYLLFDPGERYEYSNSGIILLGALIEQVSGMDYGAYIDARIIRPLHLDNTGYYRSRNVVERQAVPYRLSANGLEFTQRSKHFGDNAGGGLYSNPSDLFSFVKGLEAQQLLSEKYTELMFRPQIKSGESDEEGYGWSIKYFGEEQIYFAAGSGYGTKSVIIRMPESGDFIGITSNWGNTPILQLLRDLYLTARGQPVSLPSDDGLADPGAYSDRMGQYTFVRGELKKHLGMDREEIRLHEFEGRLFLDDELLAAGEGYLRLTYTDELKIFFKNQQMIIEINGNTLIGNRTLPGQ
ncbi:CubicO group peptidase, beta-lactamase class C family [Cyclobacterium lianum]|uniref:CubicO group peptidase, beta-lactamase class C family n=1 Tax=Cyclobacterium lianum TaxID=388280 RepID=A0A1M7IW30_9BACT|nr:serine hydrolase domain-containing protein [Cyclobacterium lianum]SHM45004.1 CubicO group peptidase, beta-lactamase class C family [Cyclobacterium lianum]